MATLEAKEPILKRLSRQVIRSVTAANLSYGQGLSAAVIRTNGILLLISSSTI